MRVNAIRCVSRRRGFVVTTRRDKRLRPASDLVELEFEPAARTSCGSLI